MNIVSSAFGHYEVIGNPADADVLIGHSFGTLTCEGSANRAIADIALDIADGRPIVADRMLVNSFPGQDEDVDFAVEGDISDGVGRGLGSWGTLVEAKKYMMREGLETALMVGQAHHIGRVAMQAHKLKMNVVIPANLPDTFDPESKQRWTRSKGMWLPREIGGSVALRLTKRL